MTKSYQVMQLTVQRMEQERRELEKEKEKLQSHVNRLLWILGETGNACVLCMVCGQYDCYEGMTGCILCEYKKAICSDCQKKHNLRYQGYEAPEHVVDFLANLNLNINGKGKWYGTMPKVRCTDCLNHPREE